MQRERSGIRRFFKLLGPGLIVGASDDDPSGIATYAVTGATLGYSTLWIMPVTLPMMMAVQYICARIGLVTGKGLGAILRERFPVAIAYPAVIALVIANSINAGADIGAIAAAINLLVPIRIVALIVPVAVVLLALQIWGSYKVTASVFKWLSLALFAYVGSAFFAHPDVRRTLVGTFVPHLHADPGYITTVVAIIGTTISPYMFFWQATQEVEEDVAFGRHYLWQRKGTTDQELRYTAWDVGIGMFFSQFVGYFIILSTAATLFATGHNNIATAADAARALEPIAGRWSEWLLALGLIGSGFLAVPILTASSAYAMSEIFGWRFGLDKKPGRAPQFYGVIALSTIVGIELNFVGIGPVTALYWTAVINGFLAPLLLVLIMLVSGNRRIMGERANGPLLATLGWLTTAAMLVAAAASLMTMRS
ncbi:MAG: divalent metal cation transporter [Candidatus Eremiobacteraeota bacterium]|nr:divalent metal cation transporter [Candidatus Eremiobacteraeota bacterium]MBV8340272.1 divalent metal cation transporter [Candidatus Eremiobacteraeota bacterium]